MAVTQELYIGDPNVLCHDIKPWLRNVPSYILTDAATVTMYKSIKLVVEITDTPPLEAVAQNDMRVPQGQ